MPYQTLVQTVITDDAVRKGIEADDYDMTWVTVCYGVGVIYGLFSGVALSLRIGKRYTLVLGMLVFSAGNILCGAATGLVSLALARFVEGFGKMLAMAVGRATLYKQFDHALLVAIGFYGIFSWLDVRHRHPARQRVPSTCTCPGGGVLGLCAGRVDRGGPGLAVHPPRSAAEAGARPDRLACHHGVRGLGRGDRVRLLVVPQVGRLVLERVPRRPRWSLCVGLTGFTWSPGLARGFSPDEHLNRILRLAGVCTILCLTTRGLMLLHMVAVLTIIGMYCTELRGYPRITAGWLMVPTSVTMATTTFLTTRFHRRSLRHVWGITGFVGSAACVWWMSSIDNFTPKEHVAAMLACWGAFIGLIPPVFLTDEIEGLNPKDMLYASALGIVGLVVPIITVPTATGTVIKVWSDRALDVYRLNLRENRPAVEAASARVADYFHQRGLSGAALQQETSRVLGGFVTLESVAHGFRSGLRFLSLMMLVIGLVVAIALALSAKGLRAPPESGYT